MNPHNIHQNSLTLRMWIIWIHEFPYEFDVFVRKMPERKFLTCNPTRHNAGTYKVGHSSVAWAQLERGLHFWSSYGNLPWKSSVNLSSPGTFCITSSQGFLIFPWRHLRLAKWHPTTSFVRAFFPTTHSWWKGFGQAHLPKETNFLFIVIVIELRWCHPQKV